MGLNIVTYQLRIDKLNELNPNGVFMSEFAPYDLHERCIEKNYACPKRY